MTFLRHLTIIPFLIIGTIAFHIVKSLLTEEEMKKLSGREE